MSNCLPLERAEAPSWICCATAVSYITYTLCEPCKLGAQLSSSSELALCSLARTTRSAVLAVVLLPSREQ